MVIEPLSIADEARAPGAVVGCLNKFGFAVVVDHGVPAGLIRSLYDGWEAFFASDERVDYAVADLQLQTGYFGMEQAETAKGASLPDLKEYFQYRPGCSVPAQLEALTEEFHCTLFELGKRISGWIQAETPPGLWQALDQPFADYLDAHQSLLRVLYYPGLTGAEAPGALRAEAHEDINLVTLLPAATSGGLEIKPKGGGWVPVEAPEGAIIINTGDMLQELTKGVIPSTPHRVVNPEGQDMAKARVTAPFFCHPVSGLRLSERHTAGSYLDERLREINAEGLTPA